MSIAEFNVHWLVLQSERLRLTYPRSQCDGRRDICASNAMVPRTLASHQTHFLPYDWYIQSSTNQLYHAIPGIIAKGDIRLLSKGAGEPSKARTSISSAVHPS
jgi:hypothetical protein